MADLTQDVYKETHYRHGAKSKKNALLIKPVVGHGRATTYSLPPVTHTYGKKETGDEAGVREAVGSWKQHVPNAGEEPPRDFVKINQKATSAGATNPKLTAQFRKTIDIRVQTSPARTTGPADPFAGVTFGMETKREDTPMASVLSNAYQRQWIVQNREAESKEQDFKSTSKTHLKNSTLSHTRASIGHFRQPAEPPKERFMMSRFHDVQPKVNSYKGGATFAASASTSQQHPEVYVPAPGSPGSPQDHVPQSAAPQ